MSSISKKKKKNLTLRDRYRRSKLRQTMSEFVTWIENTIQLDRKRAKLLIIMIVLGLVFFIDLVWLVLPPNIRHKPTPPEYSKEQIPTLVAQHQMEIEENPRDFHAHYELGKIFMFVKEPEKAKVEFFQAVECAPDGNYNAHFALAKLYVYYREPEMIVKILGEVDDRRVPREMFLQKVDYIYKASQIFFAKGNLQGSYAALQEAYNDYGHLGEKEKLEIAKKDLCLLLVDMADQAYYEEKNPTKAMVYLENSLKLEENALAYVKLGYLFFENPKISADYFEKGYSFEPKAVNLEVFIPTLIDAIVISENENRMADKSYYKGVLVRVRQENLVSKIHTKLIPNNTKGFYEKNDGKPEYLPIAYLDIYNGFDRKDIDYLKVRAVFVDIDGRIIGHHDVIAILPSKPLHPHESLINVRLESNRFVSEENKQKNIYKVLFYFSKTRPDEWAYAAEKILQ